MPLEINSTDIAERVALEIHSGNPREGPGSLVSTRHAFSLLNNLPPSPRVLDIGCGPGQQSLEIAKLSKGVVTALDIHPPFLEKLAASARQFGLGDNIKPMQSSMDSINLPSENFDLIWSEGAIYIIGFERGLKEWKSLIARDGWLVASHLSWLKRDIPPEPRKFWQDNYPAITTVEANIRIVEAQGYRNEAQFTLPENDWWDEYYNPISQKLESLRQKYQGSEEAQRRIGDTQREIDLYRRYSDYYGYVFYIMQKR